MRKIWVIAVREYLSAVRSKTFLVTILFMPILMGASIGLQTLFRKMEEAKDKRYAVIDRTKDQKMLGFLEAAFQALEMEKAKIPEIEKVVAGKVNLVAIPPSEDTPEAMAQQRFELSNQVEAGQFEAVIEIGEKIYEPNLAQLLAPGEKLEESRVVRFQAKNVQAFGFRSILGMLINKGVQMDRLEQKGLTKIDIAMSQAPVSIRAKALTRPDSKTGKLADAADETPIINMILPGALIGLMFMVITIGATPAMHGVIEEKSQRIAEVLLGSVAPFQLMAGKLLGLVGVAVTMAGVYLGGGLYLADHFGYYDQIPIRVLLWFFPMLVLALLIFGSIFIAVGAAATEIKDTQTLLMPIMLIACLPFFALTPIMQEPNGTIARVCSLIPFATPMLLVARESVPPGVPWWEMTLGIVLVLASTALCVWVAGRIFRIGILMHGKPARFIDLVRWAIRG